MKKINLYITIILITAIFHSCNERLVPDVPVSGDKEITIKVSSLGGSDTKASYSYTNVSSRAGYMVWNNGDKIGLFETVLITPSGSVTPIVGPSQNAQFNIASGSGGSRSARFSGQMTDPGNAKFAAYYPYNPNVEIVHLAAPYSNRYTVYSPFPYNQTYIADSFTNVPAVAVFNSANNNGELNEGVFAFRNICNVLRFRVKLPGGTLGSHTLSRIEVSYETSVGSATYAAPSSFTVTFREDSWLQDDLDDPYAVETIYNRMDWSYSTSPTHIFDQPCIRYEIPGGHLLSSSTLGYFYHIVIPPCPTDRNNMGRVRFVMSDGMVYDVRANLGVLSNEGINKIFTVSDLTLGNFSAPTALPANSFWLP